MLVNIIEILVVMAFSAFFSGMEIAFVSSSKLRFEMEKDGMKLSANILSYFYNHPNDFISTILIGNNIALVIYGILMADLIGTHFLSSFIDNAALSLFIQTILSTALILVTGEFFPKTFFKIDPNFSLRMGAIPLFICYVVLYPVSKITSVLSSLLLRIVGKGVSKEISDKAFTKVDLDHLIQSSIEDEENEEDIDPEVKIFQNALDFSETKLRDCLIPRTEIVALEKNATLEELKQLFIESGISKVIVYDDNIDNIIGYIHSSEMFKNSADWTKSIKQIPIVPETMSAHKLMKLFMQQKKSLAVVVDEFGGTSGIVSLEDIVEEIFGDIQDEHDTVNYVCKQINESEFVLSARLEIEKVNETFGLNLPESDEYQTVGGLILDRYQGFPKLNEEVEIDDYKFKIIKLSATKIELVKLMLK